VLITIAEAADLPNMDKLGRAMQLCGKVCCVSPEKVSK